MQLPRSLYRLMAKPVAVVLFLLLTSDGRGATPKRPNVVMIMTDNHGAWTLGCYGNRDIRTPNIDRLAAEGTLFEQAFASNPVCSPTRATVLTGLIPSQHGVHCFLRGGHLQTGPDARCTLDKFTSLPEVLKNAGYRCGLVGKWHLGGNMTPQEGFDDYWITMPHGGTSTFYDAKIIENGSERTEPTYLTDFWTEHALKFIHRQAQDKSQPFFLFLSYNGPYSLSRLLLREGRNRHAEFYRDQDLPSFPREPAHPWQLHNLDYSNNPTSIRRVATEVSGVDDGVGTVLEALAAEGLDKDTVVIFLADQGWVGGHGGFFGMGDHTRPVTARDGMMQIPMIWRHPQRIAASQRVRKLVANYDVMPTLMDYLDIDSLQESPDAAKPVSPGTSFAEQFRASAADPGDIDDAVFYEFESLRCIRTNDWKYIHRHPNGPHELYHLQQDPEEFNNLYDRPQHKAILSALQARLQEFYAQNASPEYDLWQGGGSQTFIYDGIEEEIAQAASVDPPPLPVDFSPQAFTLPEGFSAELVAGPPLVTHPTMGCFDDRGRLFICNNAGVNMSADELEKELPNSINMLEDRDGDGVFDRSTVFADRMTFPMGGAWHDGALFVASPPSIWRLEDTDNDGVADKRDVIVDHFGFTGNAASIHGCFFSPDGRLYWCDGYHGHEFRDENGDIVSKRKGSYLFSCQPNGSDVQIHCGGGMDNPVEVDFTDEGDVIGTVNIMYTRPRVDCLVHWQYGGAYPHREAVLEELPVTGELLGPIHRFGHVAISGTTRYRGGVLDHRWRGNFFATQFNLGKVVRVELERNGSTFSCTEREFLSCGNRDFHPTDIIEDADGSLLVVDTGGWFYRGCPTSQIAKPDVLGGIYRIRRDGMTTQVDPRGLRINWSSRTIAQLMQDLKDTRFAVREKAIQECVRRGDAVVDRLAATVQSGDIVARRNAIWSLTRMISQNALQRTGHPGPAAQLPSDPLSAQRPQKTSSELVLTSGLGQANLIASAEPALTPAPLLSEVSRSRAMFAVRQALFDRDPGIRQTACHAIAVNPDSEAETGLAGLLDDDHTFVQREAARALGRIKAVTAIPTLVESLATDDRELAHAATYALIEIGDAAAIERVVAGKPDAATRIRARVAVMQIAPQTISSSGEPVCAWPQKEAVQREYLRYYRDHLANLRKRSLADGALVRKEMALVFQQLLQSFLSDQTTDGMLATFVADHAAVESIAESVGSLLSSSETAPRLRAALLAGIARSGAAVHDSWTAPLVSELTSDNPQQVAGAITAITAISAPAFKPHLEAIAANELQLPLTRLAALEALLSYSRTLSSTTVATLLRLTAAGSAAESTQAARILGAASLKDPDLQQVAALLKTAGPQQLTDLVPLFNRSLSPGLATAFLNNIEDARSLNSVPRIAVSEVVKRFPTELHERANQLLDRMQAAEQTKLRKLDSVVSLLRTGSPEGGRDVFFSEKAKCATCHVVGRNEAGELLGRRLGPDLTTIGANRSSKDLLESILFPSATIVRQYEPYTLVTTSGRTYSGLVLRDTSTEVVIQPATGEPVTVSRDQVEELVPATVSIMPRGLDETLTPQQIADMVVWLQTLR